MIPEIFLILRMLQIELVIIQIWNTTPKSDIQRAQSSVLSRYQSTCYSSNKMNSIKKKSTKDKNMKIIKLII